MDMRIISFLVALSWLALKGLGDSSFEYTVLNQLQEPYINESIHLKITPNNYLIYYMEEACMLYPQSFIRFTVTFYPIFGYFVNDINGATANYLMNKTYWQILNKSSPLNVGVTYYVPKAGDSVLFNLTQI